MDFASPEVYKRQEEGEQDEEEEGEEEGVGEEGAGEEGAEEEGAEEEGVEEEGVEEGEEGEEGEEEEVEVVTQGDDGSRASQVCKHTSQLSFSLNLLLQENTVIGDELPADLVSQVQVSSGVLTETLHPQLNKINTGLKRVVSLGKIDANSGIIQKVCHQPSIQTLSHHSN